MAGQKRKCGEDSESWTCDNHLLKRAYVVMLKYVTLCVSNAFQKLSTRNACYLVSGVFSIQIWKILNRDHGEDGAGMVHAHFIGSLQG